MINVKDIVQLIKNKYQQYQTQRFLTRDYQKDLGIPPDWEKSYTKKADGVRYRPPRDARATYGILKYEDRCSRMKLVLETIADISEPIYQRKIWIERSIPDFIDSWEECMCRFFDDTNIDEFLDGLTPESKPEFGLTQRHIDELQKFRDYADNYCSVTPKYMDPRKVLADPRWHEVVECAQETLKVFEGYQVPPDPA